MKTLDCPHCAVGHIIYNTGALPYCPACGLKMSITAFEDYMRYKVNRPHGYYKVKNNKPIDDSDLKPSLRSPFWVAP